MYKNPKLILNMKQVNRKSYHNVKEELSSADDVKYYLIYKFI